MPPPEPLDESDKQALYDLTHNRAMTAALKKFLSNHEEYYTTQARNALNDDPKDLHQKAANTHKAHKYASMAKAWGTMWAELETAVKG